VAKVIRLETPVFVEVISEEPALGPLLCGLPVFEGDDLGLPCVYATDAGQSFCELFNRHAALFVTTRKVNFALSSVKPLITIVAAKL
jgi:hypothetical protein